MSEIPTIGDVVREWRQYWQISLTEFSQKTQLSKGYISELEHNKIDNPKKNKLERLAPVLRISVMDIISRRMPPEDREAQTAPSSKPGVAGQGGQQVSAVEVAGGQQLRRRRGGAFASSPIEDIAVTPEHEVLRQQIEMILEKEGLSKEECSRIAEVLVPHITQLVRMVKLMRGNPT